MSPATASFRHKLRVWAQRLKLDSLTLWFALRHAQTPLLAKAACAVAVGYALSPIDLIPDFIPVLGYADDAIVVAIALRFATRRAGSDAVKRHWPGTPEGLSAVLRLAGLKPSA